MSWLLWSYLQTISKSSTLVHLSYNTLIHLFSGLTYCNCLLTALSAYDPFSLTVNEARNHANPVTLPPCALGEILCYTKALCNMGCRAGKEVHRMWTEIFFSVYHCSGVCWRPGSTSTPQALSNGTGQTVVKDWAAHTPGAGAVCRGGTQRDNRDPSRFPSPTSGASLWNPAGQTSDCRKATWTLRRWGFYAACLRMYRVRYQHTSAKWLRLGCPPN